MNEARESDQAGAPVEQPEVTEGQLQEAVERAVEDPQVETAPDSAPVTVAEAATEVAPESDPLFGTVERPVIAPIDRVPTAGPGETATEIFAASPAAALAPETAAPSFDQAVVTAPPADEIRISSDHPMAALYMQTPAPPELRGNRGPGVLIALLSTVVFALVFSGAIAAWIAPNYPPSTFLNEGLLPWVLSWGFIAATAAYFVGLSLLVLIVGRAGWWAYVLGGFLVGAAVWAVSVVGFAYTAHTQGESITLTPLGLISDFGLAFPVIVAAVVAREVTLWFGAWIGSRGRKVTKANAEALAEYDAALAELQAKQP